MHEGRRPKKDPHDKGNNCHFKNLVELSCFDYTECVLIDKKCLNIDKLISDLSIC